MPKTEPPHSGQSPRQGGSPLQFIGGLLVGLAVAGGYVKWGWKKPAVLEVPKLVSSGVIAAAVSEDLYDLSQPIAVRRRALEVIAEQRPDEIMRVDESELNGALLNAFYVRRARREAQQLSTQWSGFDRALEQPALRELLEKKYGVVSDVGLKEAMLWNALEDYEFLAQWLERHYAGLAPDELLSTLYLVRRGPKHVATNESPF